MKRFLITLNGLGQMPSAWLLFLQLVILILTPLTDRSTNGHAISWCLSALVLILIAKIIQRSPIYSAVGLCLVVIALSLSGIVLIGFGSQGVLIAANIVEAAAYIYAAFGLLMYMFSDKYVTRDELFAAASVFTLFAWAFAFLYSACQIIYPQSFGISSPTQLSRSWLELLFLSFSVQSGTGLSDIVPVAPEARILVALQMFCGVMYLALIVSRLVTLRYVPHKPSSNE